MTASASDTTQMPTGLKAHIARAVELFENLSPARLPDIGQLYADDAFFKDPFNEVNGS